VHFLAIVTLAGLVFSATLPHCPVLARARRGALPDPQARGTSRAFRAGQDRCCSGFGWEMPRAMVPFGEATFSRRVPARFLPEDEHTHPKRLPQVGARCAGLYGSRGTRMILNRRACAEGEGE
jgi:hypothetical protein